MKAVEIAGLAGTTGGDRRDVFRLLLKLGTFPRFYLLPSSSPPSFGPPAPQPSLRPVVPAYPCCYLRPRRSRQCLAQLR